MSAPIGLFLASLAGATDLPRACVEYRALLQEVGQLGPNVVLLRPGQVVTIGAQGRQLLKLREQMAIAMQADAPDLAAIERLMRAELSLRTAVGDRLANSDLACKLATLRTYNQAKLKETLENLRPRTGAEIEQQKRTVRPAPPPPAPRSRN